MENKNLIKGGENRDIFFKPYLCCLEEVMENDKIFVKYEFFENVLKAILSDWYNDYLNECIDIAINEKLKIEMGFLSRQSFKGEIKDKGKVYMLACFDFPMGLYRVMRYIADLFNSDYSYIDLPGQYTNELMQINFNGEFEKICENDTARALSMLLEIASIIKNNMPTFILYELKKRQRL